MTFEQRYTTIAFIKALLELIVNVRMKIHTLGC